MEREGSGMVIIPESLVELLSNSEMYYSSVSETS